MIANKLRKRGRNSGWISGMDDYGHIWIVDAHREGKHLVVHADEKMTAFVELERAIYEFAVSLVA